MTVLMSDKVDTRTRKITRDRIGFHNAKAFHSSGRHITSKLGMQRKTEPQNI